MNSIIFKNIAKIIERDSKTSTYKFALLRGTIDIIQENDQFIEHNGELVSIPLGLLINKWIFYYYPLFSTELEIHQINTRQGIAFRNELIAVINYYENGKGGMSVLYKDLRIGSYEHLVEPLLFSLYSKLKDTIVNMPMKYIGYSINKAHHSIYQYQSAGRRMPGDLIHGYGRFTISYDYYEAFKLFGSFISGRDSIINKWADFSYSLNNNAVRNKSYIIERLIEEPITEREVGLSKRFYADVLAQQGSVVCVWSGKQITTYDIDHIIPFSIWKNNDLWNLLPSSSSINNKKRDKIPSPETIEKAKERIVAYWELLYKNSAHRFSKEMELALLGEPFSDGWQEKAIQKLKHQVYYLINNRGYDDWSI